MATSGACKLCGVADSWRHALLNCSMARSVWALAEEDMVEKMIQCDSDNAKDWFFKMIDTLSYEQLIQMAITLWAVWGARRKAVYEDIFRKVPCRPTSSSSLIGMTFNSQRNRTCITIHQGSPGRDTGFSHQRTQ